MSKQPYTIDVDLRKFIRRHFVMNVYIHADNPYGPKSWKRRVAIILIGLAGMLLSMEVDIKYVPSRVK